MSLFNDLATALDPIGVTNSLPRAGGSLCSKCDGPLVEEKSDPADGYLGGWYCISCDEYEESFNPLEDCA